MRSGGENAVTLFPLVVENLEDHAVFSLDLRGRITSWNDGAQRLLGYTEQEVVGERFSIILTPDDADCRRHEYLLALALREGLAVHEGWHVRKDRSRFCARGKLIAVHDEQGELTAFVSVVRDLTSRKHAEREARDRTTLLEATMEASIDGILVVYREGADKILEWNRRFQTIWGFSDSEMEPRSDEALLAKAAQKVADPEGFRASTQHYYDNPELSGHDEVPLADGRVLYRHTAPIRDPDCSVQGRGWYFRDITQQKRAEHALQESEARFRSIFEQAGAGIGEVGFDERITLVNDKLCEMLGYDRETLRTLRVGDITHPEDIVHERAMFQQMIVGKLNRFTLEKRYIRRDGGILWAALSASAVRDRDSLALFAIGVIIDLTARKRAEAEAERGKAEAEQRTAQLQRLTAELIQTEQRERRRLAHLLHDHLQQLLVAARLHATRLQGEEEGLQQIKALIDQSIETSRSLTAQLSPPLLYEAGLLAALKWLGRWMTKTYGFTVHLHAEEEIRLPNESLRTLLFDCVRELLLNVVKHAHVSEAWVRVERKHGWIRLSVED
ncbi:MAG: PAS domain S-box protein [Phycisphaeraceae bacterium]